ncbi:hypothetical protein V6N13_084614 [Hibiscus sabdariffa]|uniref:Sulfite exporter TauE/SafE family protein n=1 Tax=Hibiscus sabdariffa TaxID=183260 RepID=A0ABR2T2B4_9ROSI
MEISSDKIPGIPTETVDPNCASVSVLFHSRMVSSAGGIGGGGLFIPILTIVAGLDLKTASGFSAFMVTGGSVSNVMYNLRAKSDRFGRQRKALIDYDIALLSEPCMLLGVSVGVVCNHVFPEWLITILFAVFLVWSTFKTCRNGVGHWKKESERVSMEEACGLSYGLVFILYRLSPWWQQLWTEGQKQAYLLVNEFNKLIFPLVALVAGGLGGVFGIGGGMLISPLLLQVGVDLKVTAATCSFMVFFSSTMSAFQYLLLGMEQTGTALVLSFICFVELLLGLLVVQKAIKEFGRASLTVFSIGIVMALSAILMTTFGVLDVWEDYILGNYMGFNLPC